MMRYIFWVIFGTGLASLAFVSRLPTQDGGETKNNNYVLLSDPETQRLLQDLQGKTTEAKRTKRAELVEVLDLLAYAEHYHRSVYGHFTKLISRLGVVVPRSIAESYDVRVVEASPDRLLMVAMSEENGQMADWLSLDQDYRLHSNFQLPLPRVEYLKIHAMRYLQELKEAPPSQRIQEAGIFQGYFRFEVKQDGVQSKSIFAVGIRPPVLGVQLDASQVSELVGQQVQAMNAVVHRVHEHEQSSVPIQGAFFEGMTQKIQAQNMVAGKSDSMNRAAAVVAHHPSRQPASVVAPEVVGGDLIIEPVATE